MWGLPAPPPRPCAGTSDGASAACLAARAFPRDHAARELTRVEAGAAQEADGGAGAVAAAADGHHRAGRIEPQLGQALAQLGQGHELHAADVALLVLRAGAHVEKLWRTPRLHGTRELG